MFMSCHIKLVTEKDGFCGWQISYTQDIGLLFGHSPNRADGHTVVQYSLVQSDILHTMAEQH